MGFFGTKKKKQEGSAPPQPTTPSRTVASPANRMNPNTSFAVEMGSDNDSEVVKGRSAGAPEVIAAASPNTVASRRSVARDQTDHYTKASASAAPSQVPSSRRGGGGADESAYEYQGGVMSGSGTFDSVEADNTFGVETMFSDEDEDHGPTGVARSSGQMPNPEPLVMANLMQLKAAAEDGQVCIRLSLVLSAFGMLVTSVVPFVLDLDSLTFRHGILAAYTFVLSIIIMIMDGRGLSFGRNPVGSRARLRKVFIKHFNVLRYVWGRGLLAMFAGTLHIAQMLKMTIISGGCVSGFGFIAFFFGSMAAYKLSNLKQSLTDDEFLEYVFKKHDKDSEGYLNAYEFSLFLVDIGVEFDDMYTLRSFNSIQKTRKRRVAFKEFLRWWSQCKFDDGGLRTADYHGLGA